MSECTKQFPCILCVQGHPCKAARSESEDTQHTAPTEDKDNG